MSKFVTFEDTDSYDRKIKYSIDLEDIYLIEGEHKIFFRHNKGSALYIYNKDLISKYVMPYVENNMYNSGNSSEK